jgi:hypothetical protein
MAIQVGVMYYPDRYWAIALPGCLIMLVASYATVYAAIG